MTHAPVAASREPRYYLVKRHLLDIIDSLEPGSMVPTERDLAYDTATSRNTVRLALSELVAEGRLERRQGSGTRVAQPKLIWPLEFAGFTAQATENGYAPTTHLLASDRVRADLELSQRLELRRGAAVLRIKRLRLADGYPIAVEASHLSAARFPNLGRHIRRAPSLYELLRDEYGVKLTSAEQYIQTAPAPADEAALLNTDSGAPMLVLGRQSRDDHGVATEWVTSWYRGDRIKFTARLTTAAGAHRVRTRSGAAAR